MWPLTANAPPCGGADDPRSRLSARRAKGDTYPTEHIEKTRLRASWRKIFLCFWEELRPEGFLGVCSRNAAASLPLLAHPHMLRHACGFALADQGEDTRLIQDYLGHRNIQHTVRYTATNPARFEKLWR